MEPARPTRTKIMHEPRCKQGWHGTPPGCTPPHPTLQNLRSGQHSCLGQGGEELGVFVLHRSSHFCSQHHQMGPSTIARQVRVGLLLAASCRFQRPRRRHLQPSFSRCMVVSMASWVPRNKVNPCATTSSLLQGREVQVSHVDVCEHASSSLPANLRSGHLQRTSTALQNPPEKLSRRPKRNRSRQITGLSLPRCTRPGKKKRLKETEQEILEAINRRRLAGL